MPNMNITYKMPHVSTNYIATYMYIHSKESENNVRWEEEEKVKCWIYLLWNSLQAEERNKKGSHFKQDEIISLVIT